MSPRRIPVLVDTDANNEIDDQHALAYLFFNGDLFDVVAVTVHATERGGTARQHRAEAERVMTLCAADHVPVGTGATRSFEALRGTLDDPDHEGHEAVDLIISAARDDRDEPLVLLAIGKLTNVALALDRAPDIAARVRIVWLGSNLPDPGEYNQMNDPTALAHVLEGEVPFEIVVVRYDRTTGTAAVRVTLDEIVREMPTVGPVSAPVSGRHGGTFTRFGDYSVDLFNHLSFRDDPPSRPLHDVVAVAVVKQPAWGCRTEIPAPRLDVELGGWSMQPENRRTISVWDEFDRDRIVEDFFARMRAPSLMG